MIDKYQLQSQLVKIVGPKRVKNSATEKALYSHDLAPLPKEVGLAFNTMPDAVVLPKSAEEISKIIQLAIRHDIPVIPRGAATWGFGGAVPSQGGIVLDMSAMNKILRVDPENMEVEVEAGASWKKVYDAALNKGLFIGSYPSSLYAATVGGWVNTGGIGIGSYKYGSVGAYIRNMEVVFPEGQIIQTGFNNTMSNSTGYNLNGLMVGSEGTLGIITKITLKAYPAPEILKPISIQFSNLDESYAFVRAVTKSNITPLNISFVDEKHVEFLSMMGKHTPGKGALINIALEGAMEVVRYEEKVITQLAQAAGGLKLSDKVAEQEWDERAYEFRPREVGLSAVPGEIVVPLSRFQEVIGKVYELIDDMGMEASIIGMMGDRSTVVLLPYFIFDETDIIKSTTSLSFPKKLGDIGFSTGGHPVGLGLFFAGNLPKLHGTYGAELMFNLKTMIDPHDIVNPGKLLEGVTKFGAPIPGKVMNLSMDAMALAKKTMPKDTTYERKAKEFKNEKKD